MVKLLGWLQDLTGIKLALKTILIAINIITTAVGIAGFLAVTTALVTTYNISSELMTYVGTVSSGGSGSSFHGVDIMAQFFGLLSCMGIIDAINSIKPMIFI